jgi:hypothetical protein
MDIPIVETEEIFFPKYDENFRIHPPPAKFRCASQDSDQKALEAANDAFSPERHDPDIGMR